MTIHTTTNYGLAYIDADTSLDQLAAASQQMAQTIDTALGHSGVAPYDVTSLAAETGARVALGTRVSALEASPGRKVTKTISQAVTTSWTMLNWENLATSTSGPGMWVSGTPSRLIATAPGRYRGLLSLIGCNALQVRKNSAGNAAGGTQVAAINEVWAANLYLNCPFDEVTMVAGDYLEAFGVAGASGQMGTMSGYTAYFSMTRSDLS